MKKMFLITFMLILVLTVSGCKKTKEEAYDVIFYTFKDDLDGIPPIRNVKPGSLIPEPEKPEREGYRFDGWYKTVKRLDGEEWDFKTDKLGNQAIVLYARWVEGIYTISYELSGGELAPDVVLPEKFKVGERLSLSSRVYREGFTFQGWYTYPWVDENSTKPGDPGNQTVPTEKGEDIILYAHWKPIKIVLSYSLNLPSGAGANGNTLPPNVRYNYGDTIPYIKLNDLENYRFIGWNTRRDGSGTLYTTEFINKEKNNLKLYAQWEAK